MADDVKQEIQEGQEQEGSSGRRRFSMSAVMVIVAVTFLVVAAGVFVLTQSGSKAHGTASSHGQDPDSWQAATGAWVPWDLGTVWVSRRTEPFKGDRKVSASFTLVVVRSFLESLAPEQQTILKLQVQDLIQSILDSREMDVVTDPKKARIDVRDDLMRGLKIGANPNDPDQKTYLLPFKAENLIDVFVKELQITQW